MKVFLVILFAFALSVSAFSDDRHMLDATETDDDDASNEPIVTNPATTPTRPTSSATTAPPTTTVEETTPPPPPVVKPTIPDKIEDIVEEIVKEDTTPSQTPNQNEKETIIQPPITVSNETTVSFVEKINQINNQTKSEEQPTFPEVTTQPDAIQTKPAQAKMSTYDFPKKTTYLGIDVVSLEEKPPLQGTLGNAVEKTNIVVSSSKQAEDGVSLNILSSVESSYIVNTEIDVFTGRSSSSSKRERLLQDTNDTISNIEKILTVSECGIFKNITNTTMENVKINIYGDVIFNCSDSENGIIANTIDNSHLINVRIEFMNKNARIVTIEGKEGSKFGLIAGKISNSTVYYVRVVGDILNIRDSGSGNENGRRARLIESERAVDASNTLVFSPLFGSVESTDIMNSYVDINNVLISSSDIVYGGIAGEYLAGIPPVERYYNDSSKPAIIQNTFSIIRKGLTVVNEKAGDSKAVIGGLIGKMVKNGGSGEDDENSDVEVESCYSSTTFNGLDHPKLIYGGLIGDNSELKSNVTFIYSYVVMNVKSAYLHDAGSVTAFVNDGNKGENVDYERCYGYISSPFIVNRTENDMLGNLTYYYINSKGFNKTDILVRYLQSNPSPDKVIIYGSGANIQDEAYQENEKAVEELKKNGYNINPYNQMIPTNNAPGTTPLGLYIPKSASSVWAGIKFNPESRDSDSTYKLKFLLLPDPISTRKICPNNCNGNGKCINGICYCNEGYNGVYCQYKTCPYGYMFNDPAVTDDKPEGIAQICSNQGHCNKETGLCECFPGFQGNACQRKECPNDCNNHGICITVNKVESEDMVDYEMNYVRKYEGSNGEKVQVCVCDKEYEGYDCSLRKCPVGYSQMSECDAQPQSIITFTFAKPSTSTTDKNIYLRYTDPFGRVWYTLGFKYDERDEWIKALTSLPSGTISIDRVDDITDATNTIIQVTYSKYQTGRQVPIQVLTTKQIEELSKQYSFIKNENLLSDNDKKGYEYEDSLPPTPCSGNGLCDSVKGLCNCFSGFYGNSCSAHSSVV